MGEINTERSIERVDLLCHRPIGRDQQAASFALEEVLEASAQLLEAAIALSQKLTRLRAVVQG